MSKTGGRLQVIVLSYWITEEAGGPGQAAAGFAAGLARHGADVVVIARGSEHGRWIVDDESAERSGFRLIRTNSGAALSQVRQMYSALSRYLSSNSRTVLWVNGIWGPQSMAAWLGSGRGQVPYVVRPAGSLGRAAMARKAVKKKLYLAAIESHALRAAHALHCMSDAEVAELPGWLQRRAFVVPSGVEMPGVQTARPEAGLVGVLARLHPIKRHDLVLDAVERLVTEGRDLRLEFAGTTSDPAYERRLRERVQGSSVLRGRVSFLGHIEAPRVHAIVGRWQAAILLSDQENFGHAVISAAASGVPSVVSSGVGLSRALVSAGAGLIAPPGAAASTLASLLDGDRGRTSSACVSFARNFRWDHCARQLLVHLEAVAG